MALPFAARAQPSSVPLVGYLSALSPEPNVHIVEALHRGLGEAGYLVGQNVRVEYRWAKGRYDHLPTLTADL